MCLIASNYPFASVSTATEQRNPAKDASGVFFLLFLKSRNCLQELASNLKVAAHLFDESRAIESPTQPGGNDKAFVLMVVATLRVSRFSL